MASLSLLEMPGEGKPGFGPKEKLGTPGYGKASYIQRRGRLMKRDGKPPPAIKVKQLKIKGKHSVSDATRTKHRLRTAAWQSESEEDVLAKVLPQKREPYTPILPTLPFPATNPPLTERAQVRSRLDL